MSAVPAVTAEIPLAQKRSAEIDHYRTVGVDTSCGDIYNDDEAEMTLTDIWIRACGLNDPAGSRS